MARLAVYAPTSAPRSHRGHARPAQSLSGPLRDTAAVGAHILRRTVLGRRGEELERKAIRVPEREAQAVAGLLDTAVPDPEFVESGGPLRQLGPVGACEGEVV